MTDDTSPCDLRAVHPGDQAGDRLVQTKPAEPAAVAKSGQIDRIDTKSRGQCRDVLAPPAARTGESVEQNDGRSLTGNLVEERGWIRNSGGAANPARVGHPSFPRRGR